MVVGEFFLNIKIFNITSFLVTFVTYLTIYNKAGKYIANDLLTH